MYLWTHGSCCLARLAMPSHLTPLRYYSAHQTPGPPPPTNPSPPDGKSGAEVVKERAVTALQVQRTVLHPC